MITLILVGCIIYGAYQLYSKHKTSKILVVVTVVCLVLDVACIFLWSQYKDAPERLQEERICKATLEESLAERKADIAGMTAEGKDFFYNEIKYIELKIEEIDEQIKYYEKVLNRGNNYLNFLIAFGLLDES